MEELCDKVKNLAVEAVGEPLKTSMSANLLFREKVLKQLDADTANQTATEKYMAIEKKCQQLLEGLYSFPDEVQKEVETKARNVKAKKVESCRESLRHRTKHENQNGAIQTMSGKTTTKKKREGRLPISIIPKKPKRSSFKANILTDLETEYIQAFTNFHPKIVEANTELLQHVRKDMVKFYKGILSDKEKSDQFNPLIPQIEEFLKLWSPN
jgi:hypothetical protein